MSQIESVPLSDQAESFFVKMLVKTALKSIIWCTIAAVISYFWPEAAWVWYVVLAFVCIGLAAALLGKGVAIYAKRGERMSGSATDSNSGSEQ